LGLVPLNNLSEDAIKLLELNLYFIHEFQGNHGEHSRRSEAVLPIDRILALVLEVEIQFMLGDEHLNNLLANQVEIRHSVIDLVPLFQGLNARDEVHVHLESTLNVIRIHVQQNVGELDAFLQQLFVLQLLYLERLRFFFGQTHEAVLEVFGEALIDFILLKMVSTLDQVDQSDLLGMIFFEALREDDPFAKAFELYFLQIVVERMDFNVDYIGEILLLRLQFIDSLLE
jgi:hypothetical protein